MTERIAIPKAFRRTETRAQTKARATALAERLALLEREYWRRLNADGRWLVRRAGFTAFVDAERRPAAITSLRDREARRVFIDGDECAP